MHSTTPTTRAVPGEGRGETIYIVEDDSGVRESLQTLLDLCGYRPLGFESVEAFLAAQPQPSGAVIADLRLPGASGLTLLEELASRGLDLPVVVITAHGDIASAKAALRSGAVDFLEKPIDNTQLLAALDQALHVQAERRERRSARAALEASVARLTDREREVFDLVVAGHHNREIAVKLDISPRTVEVYRARLMEKLGVRRLAELLRVKWALDHPDEPV